MIRRLLYILLTMILLCSGCAAQLQNTNADPDAVTFTDDLGRTVTVAQPQRVAALLGSFAEIWQLAGGDVAAAPDDAWDDFQLSLAADTVNLGNTKQLSLEQLFAADPDFVLASTNTKVDLDWMDTLEQANIPVAYFDVADFPDYLRMLEICTQITGRTELYERNGRSVQTQIDAVIAASKTRIAQSGTPTVLFLRASASSIRAKNSSGSVLGEMLHALGCRNIADSDTSLLQNLSLEHIIASDPDLIFFVQSGDDTSGTQAHIQTFIAQNPVWNHLTAVENNRVFIMDKRLYNLKPNARWGEAYENLEAILAQHH